MNERDIFLAALEKPTAEARSEYLSLVCAGDPTLRQQVDGLLQMHANTGEFLQTPLVERLADGVAALEDAAETGREPSTIPKGSQGLDFLSPSEQPGSLGRLGHYEVQEVIGSGGMGIVLRAFDERLHRVVAIKVMAAPLAASAASRKRFQREARAAAAVCHDHIVTIHAVEETGDLPYLVMQCISGLSLQQRIDRDGPLELHEILRIGMQAAAGLAAAHAQGLIHRDIKPANILLENGVERVRITDFGLARAAADASISQSGIVAGTPQYMAPEQARGEALDGRTDLFSLGSVLYAMCTGRAPFRATSSIAVLKRVCEEAPSPIREANADIPEWLVALIDRLQAKNPDDRYQTAAEVAELLGQRLAQLQNSTALPPPVHLASGGRKPPDSAARHNRRWAIAAALLLGLAATLGLAEGTGATKFSATVIRLLTPEGTLVVEVTDPGVKVTIDGDGGLVITGVGQHEVRLKPGLHKLLADKNGKPVPLTQDLVTITRGDKTPVVRVSLEGAAAPSVAAPKGDAGVFVVLSAKGVEVRKCDTLAEAVQGTSAGDTLEIRGNGPFISKPVFTTHDMTIRAGQGFRPVIRFERPSPVTGYYLLHNSAHLTLEGLEFQTSSRTDIGLVHAGPSLDVTNCRFYLPGRDNTNYAIWTGAENKRCTVRNCEFAAFMALTGGASGGEWVVENCVYAAGAVAVYDPGAGRPSGTVRISHVSVVGLPHYGAIGFFPGSHQPLEKMVDFRISESVLDPNVILSVLRAESLQEKGKPFTPEGFAGLLPKLMTFEGTRNVYSPFDPDRGEVDYLWSWGNSETWRHELKGLEAWKGLWGSPETDCIEGRIKFVNGDLAAKIARDLDKVTPDDFRLRPDSAGFKAGKDGKNLGADVDLVGPGPAYERWKMTPEYQQWIKETEQKK